MYLSKFSKRLKKVQGGESGRSHVRADFHPVGQRVRAVGQDHEPFGFLRHCCCCGEGSEAGGLQLSGEAGEEHVSW